jgi:hypothetical protein
MLFMCGFDLNLDKIRLITKQTDILINLDMTLTLN